jgi:hypothetical protein
MFIFLGWLAGLAAGAVAIVLLLLTSGAVVPAFLGALAGALGPLVAALPAAVALALALFLLVAIFLAGYAVATAAIAPLLPAATGLPAVVLPLSGLVPTPGGVAVTVPAVPGELFGRGVLIGASAAVNTVLLHLVPGAGPVLGAWAFIVVSLATVPIVARSRIYQGFLGWSGWLLPLSYLATAVGLLLFVVNVPFVLAAFGIRGVAIDWTTGVIESRGGRLIRITNFNGGFSLGNFTYLAGTSATTAGPAPARFVTPTISSHETGHSLNTAATGGVVLWINAIDENVAPRRFNLAYGELNAEGHARNLPGTPRSDFSIRWWN